MAENIGFLGPGLMGKGIVKNLLGRGDKVMIYAHREGLKLDDLVGAGATVTKSLTDLGQKNATIMICAEKGSGSPIDLIGARKFCTA